MSSTWKGLAVGLWLLTVLCATVWAETDSSLDKKWKQWKKTHKKKYQNEVEEMSRRELWEQKLMEINAHNLEASQGLHTYTKGLNQLSDLTEDELMRLMPPVTIPEDFETTLTPREDTDANIPASVDWRTAGYVSSVKHQGMNCGSCWAFSAVGALEDLHFKTTGKRVELSPQNLVDCATKSSYLCYGCDNGTVAGAFQYVIDNKGINSERTYPYQAKVGSCAFKPNDRATTCSSYGHVGPSEDALKTAVATIGPISVIINGTDVASYQKGVFNTPCSPGVNHYVLAVGYDTDKASGLDYWLIKNSWGTNWGENGYLRLARNKNQLCGISTYAIYPKK